MNKKIIVISAVWCPSCLLLKKHLKKLKQEYEMDIELLDYDLDDIEEYNIGNTLPVIISFINNKEIDRLIGERTYEEIINYLERSKII